MLVVTTGLIAITVTKFEDRAEAGNCPLTDTRFSAPPVGLASLKGRGCRLVNTDTGIRLHPRPLWGAKPDGREVDCQSPDRHIRVRLGGDRQAMGTGRVQTRERTGRFRPFRRLLLKDGDDLWGERCELGNNENRHGDGGGGPNYTGTFALYPEGERRVTFLSVRLPKNFRLSARSWQTIM